MSKDKKIDLRSRYDIIMEEFEKEGKVYHFTDKENSEILKGLNEGLDDFNRQQTINQIESKRELKNIILD
jgi:hypothetical protein